MHPAGAGFTKGRGAAKIISGLCSPTVQLCHHVLPKGASKVGFVIPCLWDNAQNRSLATIWKEKGSNPSGGFLLVPS